jgi:hypothetical protein
MNDEELIWEAYTTKRNKKPQREFDREVDAIYELKPDEYRAWSRKMYSMDMDSPEYKHHYDIEIAITGRRDPAKQKYEAIRDAVDEVEVLDERTGHHDMETEDNIKQIFWLSGDHVHDEGYWDDAPSYYDRILNNVIFRLADSEFATPAVKAWYAKHGYVG